MAKISLSVCSDYLPNWGVKEGIRELLQNFLDSQDDSGVKGQIKFEGSTTGRLLLINHGAKEMSREALLFGVTSKAHREDQRGQFGEGMKVGTLALVRAGKSVTIRTQTEVWKASLTPSSEYGGRKVLTFTTSPRTHSQSVEIEVYPVTQSEWSEIKENFLDLQEGVECNNTPGGSMLTGSYFQGKIYCKGIFVTTIGNCKWGYNLSNLTLNRDRSHTSHDDISNQVSEVITHLWRDGVLKNEDIINLFFEDKWEASDSSYHWSNSNDMMNRVLEDIISKYPSDGVRVIVASNDAATQAESFGFIPVRIPLSLYRANYYLWLKNSNAWRKSVGVITLEEAMEIANKSVAYLHSISDLTEVESSNLSWAINTLKNSKVKIENDIEIVTFKDEKILGLYKNGVILISKNILGYKEKVLGTLIHEYSHFYGGDGTIIHTQMIEYCWEQVAKKFIIND